MTGFLGGSLIGVGQGGDINTGDIEHSLRFRGAQYLSRTLTTAATSTYHFKFKRGKLGVISPIIEGTIKFNANDTLTAFGLTTTAVFRDPTAFLKISISNNGLYINGEYLGAVTTSAITNGRIGFDGTNYLDGYLARFCVVSGSSVVHTSFDTFTSEINEWVTKPQSTVKGVVDAGAAASFMLDFDDGTSLTTLGYDKSVKGNNWTLNGFSLTPGVTYDWMDDVPGNSFATLNPLAKTGGASLSNGNLNNSLGSTGSDWVPSTFAITIPAYAEFFGLAFADAVRACGVMESATSANRAQYYSDGRLYFNNVLQGTYAAYGSGKFISVTCDPATRQVKFYRDNVQVGTVGTIAGTGQLFFTEAGSGAGTGSSSGYALFGQTPPHASATYHSAAGGYFRYTPPDGFLALCQANLPADGTVIPSGTFTGNAAVDGPCVWMNGSPDTLTINGNAVTFGTHADRLATGFKIRTSSASYNTAGSNTWTATISSDLENIFKYNNAKDNS